MTLPPPPQIGRYRIERELGRGTMGVVYEARDTTLGRTVALKTFGTMATFAPHEREAFEQRFLSEARISATLEDDHVVGVYDVGRDFESGLLFMALEYVRGETLAETLTRGPLPWEDAARIVAKVARALQGAHSRHIVHRDIKPANIMITYAGEPKVMDFGIAKASSAQLTVAGQVFGTPAYMSPEQASGEAVDARSDIFSLGCVLYELVTNVRPFEGASMAETLNRIMSAEPPPASTVATVPRTIDAVIGRALRKQREARYDTAAQMAADLERILKGQPALHATHLHSLERAAPAKDLTPLPRSKHLPPTDLSGSSLRPPAPGATELLKDRTRKLSIRWWGPVTVVLGLLGLNALFSVFVPKRSGVAEPVVPQVPVASSPDLSPEETTSTALTLPPSTITDPGHPSVPQTSVLSVQAPGATATISLDLKYPFRSASLRVKADDTVVFASSLSGMPIRRDGVTSGYDGRFHTDLAIPPGDHLLQLEVRSGNATFIESTRIRLRPGEGRHLIALLDTNLTLTIQ